MQQGLCDELVEMCIRDSPNIVSVFQKVDQEPDSNFFIREPLIASEVLKLLNSYNFKKDGYARICLYNDDQDFVCTATTVTTATGTAVSYTHLDVYKRQSLIYP